ncbi:hypothetical protein [Sphingomonas sp.]|uniref:hypothetical protein n=1 Tax=Sphingomonas sp. TaxID=28214 RepID=UPI0017A483BB|nr:hypothetical protein [Sphingomonas sp.]MBA3511425.1 hypothetical protein [Sphingomonas sp.]
MATVTSPRAEQLSAERRFYSRMALFLVALAFLGFAPSFYLRDIVPSYPRPNPTLTPGVILHGALFTLWMLVFVAQTQLVANGRTDIHMKLGKASMLLALLIVPMMYLIGVWQVERANQPPFTDPLNWTAVPLSAIPPYVVLVWTGWERRRQAQWHKRAMLGAAIAVVAGPAIGRLPIAPPIFAGFAFQMMLGLALFVPLMLWDRRSTGRIHPATWLGFGVVAASVVISLALVGTGTWAPIARQLPGI